MKSTLLSFAIALATIGCGDPDKEQNAARADGPSISGQETIVLDGAPKSEGGVLSGTGSVAFLAPLADQASSFEIGFALEDGGSLTVVASGDGKLANGVDLTFARNGGKLSVTIATALKSEDVSSRFTNIDASQTIDFAIDVHNHETPVHTLIWTKGGSYDEVDALFNSDADASSEGNGTGRNWGLRLAKATVISAKAGAAKFAE